MSRRLGAVLAVALATVGCVLDVENGRLQSPDVGNDPVATGRQAYLARCASCHGIEGRGDGPVGAALRVTPPDLTWLRERNGGTFPRDRVIGVVTGDVALAAHGSREMPVWSDRIGMPDGGATTAAALYTRRVLESLVAYLETIQQQLRAAPTT